MKGLFFTLLYVLIMVMVIKPPITFPYPNTRITISLQKVSPSSVDGLTDEAGDLLTVDIAEDSLLGTLFTSDTDVVRKQLYTQLLQNFDSVHAWSPDPRIDSIWRYMRPRLVYVSKEYAMKEQVSSSDRYISRIPIFLMREHEFSEFATSNSPFSEVSPDEALGYFNQITMVQKNAEKKIAQFVVPWKSISLYYSDVINIRGLTSVLYHECAHAYNKHQLLQRSDISKDSMFLLMNQEDVLNHPKIANIEASILATYLEHDANLKTLANQVTCSIDSTTVDPVVYITNADAFAQEYMSASPGSANAEGNLAFLKLFFESQGKWKMAEAQNRSAYHACHRGRMVSIAISYIGD
jgi:hypothetical protein